MYKDTALTYPEFTPGRGGLPPFLAGRAQQQAALLESLSRLRRGKGALCDVILIGPRGYGKTALMHWFERQCGQDTALDVVLLTPAGIGNNLDDLANELAPSDSWDKLKPDIVRAGIKLVNATWRLGNRGSSLTHLLTARCRQRPLVVLLDEAHTLDPKLGFVLLNVSQEVCTKAPFLLVLSGTPGLEQRLNEMDVTFWTRSKKLGIGRLDENDARDALVKPFSQHGTIVAESAVAQVIADSQCYPYFLQCWGDALTMCLREREGASGMALREVTDELVAVARLAVEAERNEHYEPFRQQIEDAGLQPLAAAVTEAYSGADTLAEHELNAAIRAHLQAEDELPVNKQAQGEMIRASRKALASFGYVWRPPTAIAVWHAGVPSLMKHVLDVERKAR